MQQKYPQSFIGDFKKPITGASPDPIDPRPLYIKPLPIHPPTPPVKLDPSHLISGSPDPIDRARHLVYPYPYIQTKHSVDELTRLKLLKERR